MPSVIIDFINGKCEEIVILKQERASDADDLNLLLIINEMAISIYLVIFHYNLPLIP